MTIKQVENIFPKVLSTNLTKLQQRGSRCKVEGIEYEGRVAFIALPEDYATSYMEYDDQAQLNKDNLRTPIFKIYFIYDSDLNILRVKSKGGRPQVCLYAELYITALTGADDWVAREHIIKANISITPIKIFKILILINSLLKSILYIKVYIKVNIFIYL
jgi:hypothetical protein